jgi:hypothetical protein
MCKRTTYQVDGSMMATEGAYEGQTVRLDARDSTRTERYAQRAAGRHGSFPWWTLWMIWPLLALAKWFVPLYAGAVAAVFAGISAFGAAPIVAIALIIVGLLLIRRK